MMDTLFFVGQLLSWITIIIRFALGVLGFAGAIVIAMTRADAFTAGDRMSKWAWCGIVGGSALVVLLGLPWIWLFGIVAIGVYWFDVYPQLRDIQRGNYY